MDNTLAVIIFLVSEGLEFVDRFVAHMKWFIVFSYFGRMFWDLYC